MSEENKEIAGEEIEETIENTEEPKKKKKTKKTKKEEPAKEQETVEEPVPEEEPAEAEEPEPIEEPEPVEEPVSVQEEQPAEPEPVKNLEEDLMECRFCGRQIPTFAKHCPYCGKALVETETKKSSFAGKKLIILGAAAVALIAILAFVIPSLGKNSTYNGAISSMKNGDYDEAIEVFRSLEGYKDADDYIVYCDALKQYRDGDIEKAISRFGSVSGLEDADNYVKYLTGIQILHGGAYYEDYYKEAADAFTEAGDFLDSAGMAEYCQGIISFMNDESSAVEKLQKVVDGNAVEDEYLDTAESAVRFLNAKKKFDNDDFSALDEFKNLLDEGNDLIASKAGDYAYYIEGLEYYEQELFYSAYNCFSKCRGLKDASELADSCYKDRPSTGILWSNTSSSVSVTIYDTSDGEDAFVKLYDYDDNLIEYLYIRDGSSATARFQSGNIRMAIAWGSGDEWFGVKEAFGAWGTYQRLLLDGYNEYYNFPAGAAFTLEFNASNGNVGSHSSNYGDF